MTHLLRLTLDISLRSAGASKGLSNSKAQSKSSETLREVSFPRNEKMPSSVTSCMHHSCQTLNYRIISAEFVKIECRQHTSAIVRRTKNSD